MDMVHEAQITVSAMRAFIDQNKISCFQWKVIIICFFIVLLDGFDISIVAYLAPVLKKEMSLGADSLSYLFVAGVLGLMFGSMIFGPLADKFGRKKLLIFSTFVYGAGSILCGIVSDFNSLVSFRFLTGVGLGGAMPICISLCSEYSPQRYRMLLCTLSWSGFTIGIAIGGVIANWVLQQLSWHWLFYFGGILPLLCVPLIIFSLPESLECLIKKNNAQATAALESIVYSINRHVDWAGLKSSQHLDKHVEHQTVMALFTQGSAVITLLLWVSFFFSLFVFYLLTYWLPIIFDGMYDYKEINYVTAMLPLGGTIGALLLALWIDYRKEAFAILSSSYFFAMGLLLIIDNFIYEYYGLLFIVFMIGFTIAGAQNGLNLISATLYPPHARATGVSWAMAFGRFGSIIGSYIGAWLVTGVKISSFFSNLSLGALVCSVALIMILLKKRRAGY
ncbi:MFS transporter [Brenneria goodwinii]|nr:MFS transporter [Brenneria goodwinii]MCG8162247.1 MFS transporter [Brenneria goodwinii]MCG8166177.1 MFS transporter [Brenneria goodwinii]MCG8170804.1 MFS transporter [Brenneria goodwinii]MCG8180900.1 MFS transporter [Brenneria goodwinii]